MATEALQELLKDYDLEQNGFLDKTEWIKLCAQDGINLSPDLASALFDGLDTDADGQVQIGDIVKELSNSETAMEFPQTPLLSDRRSLSFDQSHQGNESPSAVPLNQANRPRESRRKMKRNYQQKDHSRFLSQSSGAHSDNNGGLFTTKKELAEDGSEVFCTTPVPIHPRMQLRGQREISVRTIVYLMAAQNGQTATLDLAARLVLITVYFRGYKNLMELETEISRSYPKLLPSFNNVIEDFRTEIISSRQEQSSLEQNYLSSLMQEAIRKQYDTKIMAKEQEISEIRTLVESLKARFEDKYGNGDSAPPDSTTADQRGTDFNPPTPSPYMNRNRRPSSAQIRDQNHLQEVLAKLESREEELGKLKRQLFEQEVQIL
ncbi:EF hand, partial [Opisthorchis viverrini]